MFHRVCALCLALAAAPLCAQETPLLAPGATESAAAPELSQTPPAETAAGTERSGQAMKANEIERLLAGPKNNAPALEAITTAEPPGQAINDGAASLAKGAVKTVIAPAVTAAASGAVAAVAAPVVIVGGIAAVGAAVACAEYCDQGQK